MTYLEEEEFAWRIGGRGKLYTLTIKWTLSKITFKGFLDTLRIASTYYFKPIASGKKAYFWIFLQSFFWKTSALKMQGSLWKSISAYNVSKNAALPHVSFCHNLRIAPKNFWSFSKFFQSISASHSVPFKFMHAFIHQIKDADFWSNSSW